MDDARVTGSPARGGMPITLSRRRLLESGLVIVPGLLGSWVISEWARSVGQAGSAAPGTEPAAAYDPTQHAWGFVCDTTTCIGCGHCVRACKLENHVPADPEYNRTWVELHLVAADGTVVVESPEGGIGGFPPEPSDPAAADAAPVQSYFVPRLCMQCENPPCVPVCPVSATYRTEDGVVLVDQRRCIGCGYCAVACPYGARYMVPSGGETPQGVAGVADKCTFCYHRTTRGELPACVEVCPVEARLFGDLNDPSSRVSTVLREKRTQVMKPALGTKPRVHYVGLEGEVG